MADITFSSINVVSGQELGDTPRLFAQTAGKRAPRTGETLVLFLDLENAPAATCADIARTLSDGYWRAPGGLTTALRLAVKLANDRLVDLNRGVPAGKRAEGSLSCAVINEESVVIAQAGPAVAYARAQTGAFERVIPVDDSMLVGSTRAVEAYFTHFTWKPGDTYILTGAGSCSDVDDSLINACMAKGDARMVAGYLNANVKTGRMVGVAFALKAQPASALAGAGSSAAAAPTNTRNTRAAVEAQTQRAQPFPATADVAPVRPARDQSISVERNARTPQALSSAGAAASNVMGNAARSVQRSLATFGAQLLPASAANVTPGQRSRATVFGLAAVAILLPILVALVVTVVYFQLSGEAEKQQAINQTRQQVDLAKATPNKANWAKALSMINEYETKYPDAATTFSDDRQQAQTQLDQISKITRVAPAALVDLGNASGPRRIAAASLGVYVLNPATNDAQYYVLNVQRTGVTGKPVPLTLAGGTTTANTQLSDVTWATTSGGRWRTEGAILFSKNALYEYSSATGQMTALSLPIDANSSPGQIVAGELYNGTAYVLDTGVGQIWRYSLQGGKLTKSDTYFRSPFKQLQDSLDIAIDGAVYVLQKSGTVLKYFNRQPVSFIINTGSLPEPMGKAISLAINGPDANTGNVFIADSTNGAIWEFTKMGEFVKQFRAAHDEFIGMQDMSLDPTSNTIYVTTPGKLFSFKAG